MGQRVMNTEPHFSDRGMGFFLLPGVLTVSVKRIADMGIKRGNSSYENAKKSASAIGKQLIGQLENSQNRNHRQAR